MKKIFHIISVLGTHSSLLRMNFSNAHRLLLAHFFPPLLIGVFSVLSVPES